MAVQTCRSPKSLDTSLPDRVMTPWDIAAVWLQACQCKSWLKQKHPNTRNLWAIAEIGKRRAQVVRSKTRWWDHSCKMLLLKRDLTFHLSWTSLNRHTLQFADIHEQLRIDKQATHTSKALARWRFSMGPNPACHMHFCKSAAFLLTRLSESKCGDAAIENHLHCKCLKLGRS